jgi:hypothetical protein
MDHGWILLRFLLLLLPSSTHPIPTAQEWGISELLPTNHISIIPPSCSTPHHTFSLPLLQLGASSLACSSLSLACQSPPRSQRPWHGVRGVAIAGVSPPIPLQRTTSLPLQASCHHNRLFVLFLPPPCSRRPACTARPPPSSRHRAARYPSTAALHLFDLINYAQVRLFIHRV